MEGSAPVGEATNRVMALFPAVQGDLEEVMVVIQQAIEQLGIQEIAVGRHAPLQDYPMLIADLLRVLSEPENDGLRHERLSAKPVESQLHQFWNTAINEPLNGHLGGFGHSPDREILVAVGASKITLFSREKDEFLDTPRQRGEYLSARETVGQRFPRRRLD